MAYFDDPQPVFCTTCGREADPDARFCDNCGAALAPQAGGTEYEPGMPYPGGTGYGELPHIPNYLIQAILATICCCVPAGIVAIVYAAQVNGKVAAGDYATAQRYSNNAKTWCWVALGLGIAAAVIGIAVNVVGGSFGGF